MSADRDALLVDLAGPDPARAIVRVHRFELVDAEVLRAMLRAVRDDRPLPDDLQPTVDADPFAGFFGASGTVTKKTVGQLAAQRMIEVGWPGLQPTAEIAAEIVAEAPNEALVTLCADRLGETEWEDKLAALRTLVPALHAADAALYAVIVRTNDAGVAVMVESALSPYRSRATNELLANGNSHAMMLDALCGAVKSGALVPDEQQAMGILAQVVTWAPERTPSVAMSLEGRFPWAVTFAAFDDEPARDRMRAWLGSPYPASLPARLDEALKSRTPIEGWPLVEWLTVCDGSTAVIAAWKWAGPAADLLRRWVVAEDPERAVEAARLLVGAGEYGPVAERITALVRDPTVSDLWDAEALRELVAARIEGLGDALADLLAAAPMRAADVVPALLASEPPPAVLRRAAEAAIAHAEQAPIKRTSMRRGGTRTVREGADTTALKPLVHATGDLALDARLDAVLPYLGA